MIAFRNNRQMGLVKIAVCTSPRRQDSANTANFCVIVKEHSILHEEPLPVHHSFLTKLNLGLFTTISGSETVRQMGFTNVNRKL